MPEAQLEMSQLLADADERARAIRDLHLGRVQAFFDGLSDEHKATLSRYMTEHEYDTCLALSVAACDWGRSHLNGAKH
jgi:hypothetical protein